MGPTPSLHGFPVEPQPLLISGAEEVGREGLSVGIKKSQDAGAHPRVCSCPLPVSLCQNSFIKTHQGPGRPSATFSWKAFREKTHPLTPPVPSVSAQRWSMGDQTVNFSILPSLTLFKALHFPFQSSSNTLYIHNSVSICRERNHHRL